MIKTTYYPDKKPETRKKEIQRHTKRDFRYFSSNFHAYSIHPTNQKAIHSYANPRNPDLTHRPYVALNAIICCRSAGGNVSMTSCPIAITC